MLIPFKILKAHPSMMSEREKKIEEYLEAASLHHGKAEALLNYGDYEKVAQNALLAQKFLDLANERMRIEEQNNT